ncbi:hypothetical protein [Spirulina sp. 06S082]|uniref:hypothetical protein n=1 Tax=Spirulina sp. 06S082 TaxID=3110248 RepID=UPI002B21D6DE|nr:hypothetical protein [Spirulina sp. 06S082]MEA5468506.1 hypothetical protein [Spirulina sp. 06S082]
MSLEYLDWNELIASHFFRSEKRVQPVYLYVTESLINELGSDRGGDLQDFIKTLNTGVPWVTRHNQGICQKALQSWENWRDNPHYNSDYSYPPYIGYLTLFVLAAGIEGDFSSNSYYPRLRSLLGEELKTGQYPSFEKMHQLWEDLEQWANEDTNGEWGIFNCITIGQNRHISFPLAQMLLTEEEQKNLPNIFAEADLDPLSLPSETAIASLLSLHGKQYLRSHTLNLLNENDERCQILIERILEELNHWDGSVIETNSKIYYGNLRLCCKLDEIAGVTEITLRCTSRYDLPENDLDLLIEGNNEIYSCSEEIGGWSSHLKLNSRNLDASQFDFDWEKGFKMRSQDGEWCFKFSGSPVRILIKGQNYDLPGWVETSQLPKEKPFYLLVHPDHIEAIEAWGNSACQGFEKVRINQGLPQGWSLFKVDFAKSDNLVKSKYPNLSFPSTIRLSFKGGLRLDRRNLFFTFAQPDILLQGHNEEIDIDCQDQKLSPISFGVYQLPENLPLNEKISITARHQEEIIQQINLTLINDNLQNSSNSNDTPDYTRDVFGSFTELEESNHAKIRGAIVEGFEIPEFNFNTLLPIQGTNRIIFIGRKVGQIATPSEILEQDWTPIWAIASGRRSRVQFCGIDFNEVSPIAEKYGDRKQLKQWKKFLWYDRKVITPPKEQKLRCLWNKYQKEAKRV